MREVGPPYRDPLDHLWLESARRIGLRVVRSDQAYATTDGARTLSIAEGEHLDADDCLAQMIFHEICHSLVEGEESFAERDWGLGNLSENDIGREHACLRVQAVLADRVGLRSFLAPTTEFRAFYDKLGPMPLEPAPEPTSAAARLGLRRAKTPPWAPHLGRALELTARLAEVVGELGTTPPSLWRRAARPPLLHPSGLFPAVPSAGRSCGNCSWQSVSGTCLQAERPVEPGWPSCERWEATLDCQECAACCGEAYHSVTVAGDDPIVQRHPELVVHRDGYSEIRREGGHCAALVHRASPAVPALPRFHCSIYADRPECCREFARGGPHCLTARRRLGFTL